MSCYRNESSAKSEKPIKFFDSVNAFSANDNLEKSLGQNTLYKVTHYSFYSELQLHISELS